MPVLWCLCCPSAAKDPQFETSDHISSHTFCITKCALSDIALGYGEYLCSSLFKLQFMLGKITPRILRSINQSMRSLKQLFQVTGKLITDQKETTGIPVIDWQQQLRQRATLLSDKAVQFATSKTHVFSDSVLCLGGISPDPVRAWKDKMDWFMESRQFNELDRIDGPMEFEWNTFQDSPRQ